MNCWWDFDWLCLLNFYMICEKKGVAICIYSILCYYEDEQADNIHCSTSCSCFFHKIAKYGV